MTTGLLLIAHAPLASALRACVLHVFPEAAAQVVALDVQAQDHAEASLAAARLALANLHTQRVLVLTDVFGATPCNVAQRLVDGVRSRLVAGVNLPMALRAISYRHEPLDELVARAVAGGVQGVLPVAVTAMQTQTPKGHDPSDDHHQQ